MTGVEHELRTLHARGRAAWPGVELDIATFSARAANQLDDGPFDDVRADDLYLAIACAARVEQAVIAFDKHYVASLAPVLIRHGQDRAAAADVVQAVRVRFLVGDADRGPKIAEYNGRSSLAAWLRVAAIRTAVTAFRKHRRETAIDDVAIVARSCHPDIGLLGMQLGSELEAAFRSSFAALAPRERNLLRFQVLDRLAIDRIAALHGVHRVTAARWIARARKELSDGVRRQLQDRLGIDREELDSTLRQIASQLELSRRWLLTPMPNSAD
ncbi:MAG TPA: sigma-70 family RNA polymerase sigma factor [Kofleriaceae bacterium]|nr:sigma-70 family RNA polymerase sigma factor [Kofleriaceae bacterium]